MGRIGRASLVTAVAAVAAGATAAAQTPPPLQPPLFGGFRSVLAQGEGQSVNAVDLAQNQATGEPPARFVDQQPLYVDVMPRARLAPAGRPRHLLQGHDLRLDAGRRGVGDDPAPGRDDLPRRPLRHGAHLRRRPRGPDVRRGVRDRRGTDLLHGRDPPHRKGHAGRPDGRGRRLRRRRAAHGPGLLGRGADGTVRRAAGALRRRGRTGPRGHPGLHRRHQRAHRRGQLEPARAARRIRGAGRPAGALDPVRHGRDGGAARDAVHGVERQRGGQRGDAAGLPEAIRPPLARSLRRPAHGERSRVVHRLEGPQAGVGQSGPRPPRAERGARPGLDRAAQSSGERARRRRAGPQPRGAAGLGALGDRHQGRACPTRCRTRCSFRAGCRRAGGRSPRWARRSTTGRRRSSSSTSCTAAASTRRASRSRAPARGR